MEIERIIGIVCFSFCSVLLIGGYIYILIKKNTQRNAKDAMNKMVIHFGPSFIGFDLFLIFWQWWIFALSLACFILIPVLIYKKSLRPKAIIDSYRETTKEVNDLMKKVSKR